MLIGVLSSYTAKIEPQFNKTCLKRGGNGLKNRVTAPVQAYSYLKSFAVFNIFVANYQSLRANCYHKIRLYRLDYQSLFQENRERYEISTLPIFVYQYPGF